MTTRNQPNESFSSSTVARATASRVEQRRELRRQAARGGQAAALVRGVGGRGALRRVERARRVDGFDVAACFIA